MDRLDTLSQGVANVLIAQYRSTMASGSANGAAANSSIHRCKSGKLTISHQLQNHAGLLNINAVSQASLASAFLSLGRNNQDAQYLSEQVIAYRSFSNGSQSSRGENIIGGPKGAPLETVSELYDIDGMGQLAFRDLRKTFTVHSKSNTLALQSTPEHLKKAIEQSQSLRGAVWNNSALMSLPVTVSVTISRGSFKGQFNGIFAIQTTNGASNQIVESWRYDAPHETNGNPPVSLCSEIFGSEFANALEHFG